MLPPLNPISALACFVVFVVYVLKEKIEKRDGGDSGEGAKGGQSYPRPILRRLPSARDERSTDAEAGSRPPSYTLQKRSQMRDASVQHDDFAPPAAQPIPLPITLSCCSCCTRASRCRVKPKKKRTAKRAHSPKPAENETLSSLSMQATRRAQANKSLRDFIAQSGKEPSRRAYEASRAEAEIQSVSERPSADWRFDWKTEETVPQLPSAQNPKPIAPKGQLATGDANKKQPLDNQDVSISPLPSQQTSAHELPKETSIREQSFLEDSGNKRPFSFTAARPSLFKANVSAPESLPGSSLQLDSEAILPSAPLFPAKKQGEPSGSGSAPVSSVFDKRAETAENVPLKATENVLESDVLASYKRTEPLSPINIEAVEPTQPITESLAVPKESGFSFNFATNPKAFDIGKPTEAKPEGLAINSALGAPLFPANSLFAPPTATQGSLFSLTPAEQPKPFTLTAPFAPSPSPPPGQTTTEAPKFIFETQSAAPSPLFAPKPDSIFGAPAQPLFPQPASGGQSSMGVLGDPSANPFIASGNRSAHTLTKMANSATPSLFPPNSTF